MPVSSQSELITALAQGRYDDVLGTPESEWLDFKSQPYALGTPKQKWELAKDVAAFATAGGGLIAIGYKTAKGKTELTERAKDHRPTPKDRVNAEKLQKCVDTWIYPPPKGVKFAWYPDDPSEPKGVLLIEVPKQKDADLPFMVQMVDEEGNETGAFGIPERDGDRVRWIPMPKLHRWLHEGQRGAQSTMALTSRTEDGFSVGYRANVEEPLTRLIAELDWTESPYVALQVFPSDPSFEVSRFYGSDGIEEKLRAPDSLRPRGFGLGRYNETERIESALVSTTSRRGLWLESDGRFSVAGAATLDLLGWGMGERPKPLRVNPIVLVELTLEFFRFAASQLMNAGSGWKGIVRCVGFREHQVQIVPGFRGDRITLGQERDASSDDWKREFVCSGDAGKDALEALKRVYAIWGLDADSIPFSGDGAVDINQIQAL